MKKLTFSGGALLVLGLVFLFLSSVQFKQREEVFRVGSFSATATTSRKVPTFRWVGIGCCSAGALLVILGFAQRK